MFFSILIGVVIFGYAGWALYTSIKKSKKGKCASCELAKTCKTGCSTFSPLRKNKTEPPDNPLSAENLERRDASVRRIKSNSV